MADPLCGRSKNSRELIEVRGKLKTLKNKFKISSISKKRKFRKFIWAAECKRKIAQRIARALPHIVHFLPNVSENRSAHCTCASTYCSCFVEFCFFPQQSLLKFSAQVFASLIYGKPWWPETSKMVSAFTYWRLFDCWIEGGLTKTRARGYAI